MARWAIAILVAGATAAWGLQVEFVGMEMTGGQSASVPTPTGKYVCATLTLSPTRTPTPTATPEPPCCFEAKEDRLYPNDVPAGATGTLADWARELVRRLDNARYYSPRRPER
jgi:hypothetical protein